MDNTIKYGMSDMSYIDNQTPQISSEDKDDPEFQELLQTLAKSLPIDDKTRDELKRLVIRDVTIGGSVINPGPSIKPICLHPPEEVSMQCKKLSVDCPTDSEVEHDESEDEGIGAEPDLFDKPAGRQLSTSPHTTPVDVRPKDGVGVLRSFSAGFQIKSYQQIDDESDDENDRAFYLPQRTWDRIRTSPRNKKTGRAIPCSRTLSPKDDGDCTADMNIVPVI